MAHGWISKAWDGLAGPPERDVPAPHGCWSLHEQRWQEVTSGMVRGAAEVACHARAAGPARWPKAYLHVELSPRGGGLHHPVHHTDQGFALAHLRQTGKEISEVSGDARVLGCRRCSSVQDPPGHRAARCHLREMSQVLEPRGNSCPRLLLPCLGQSRASWGLKTLLGGEGNRSTRASSELGCSQLHAQTQACTETPTAATHRVASDRQTEGPNDRQLHVLPVSTDTLWVRRGPQPRGDSRVPRSSPVASSSRASCGDSSTQKHCRCPKMRGRRCPHSHNP